MLGAGGAARAVVRALAEAGLPEVVVVNRTAAAAETAAALAPGSAAWGGRRTSTAADLVVNATPLGMGTTADLPVDPALLRPGPGRGRPGLPPARTPLLAAAGDRGCRTVDGLGMLVHQGARHSRCGPGSERPRAVMRAAAEAALDAFLCWRGHHRSRWTSRCV